MALFRFHRGSLEESLKTTVIIKSITALWKLILFDPNIELPKDADWGVALKIRPYPDEENNFDARIGWYTHMVTANIYEKDKMSPIGFLSEALDR